MPEAVGDSSFVGKKRQRMDKPGGPGAPGAPPMKAASGAPRSRVEGRRCEVCAVIKKAGCGTENAHFRCLKRKLPEGAQELERRVGELVDVGKEERVTVWNPKEGRKLSGQAAPMLKNLVGWLASHPGLQTTDHQPLPRKPQQVITLLLPPLLLLRCPCTCPCLCLFPNKTPSPREHECNSLWPSHLALEMEGERFSAPAGMCGT
ncbi:unnamed protein product [Closterium sp. NIES-64]|nr:unnamed protein product [Closterium sp. NIES-64]